MDQHQALIPPQDLGQPGASNGAASCANMCLMCFRSQSSITTQIKRNDACQCIMCEDCHRSFAIMQTNLKVQQPKCLWCGKDWSDLSYSAAEKKKDGKQQRFAEQPQQQPQVNASLFGSQFGQPAQGLFAPSGQPPAMRMNQALPSQQQQAPWLSQQVFGQQQQQPSLFGASQPPLFGAPQAFNAGPQPQQQHSLFGSSADEQDQELQQALRNSMMQQQHRPQKKANPLYSESDNFDSLCTKFFAEQDKLFQKSYTCPICNQACGDYDHFMSHLMDASGHNFSSEAVARQQQSLKLVCPICATRPGGSATYQSADFPGHIRLRHADLGGKDELKRFYCPDKTYNEHFRDLFNKMQNCQ